MNDISVHILYKSLLMPSVHFTYPYKNDLKFKLNLVPKEKEGKLVYSILCLAFPFQT